MSKLGPCETLAEGAWGSVAMIATASGECAVVDFLESLDARGVAAMRARAHRLAETGTHKTPENFLRIQDSGSPGVYELKHTSKGIRLYMVLEGRTYYVVHASLKAKPKKLATEVEKARRLWNEWKGQ